MRKSRLLACAALAAFMPFCLAPLSTAYAQTQPSVVREAPPAPQAFDFDRGRNVSVTDRPRPDYDPPGVRLGGIFFHPGLVAEAGTDSNVFYSSANERDDIVYALKPQIEVKTDWSRHGIVAAIGLDDYRYQDSDSENHTDVYARGEGRLDVRRGSYILLGGSQGRLTERRGAPDSPLAAAKPLRYESREAHIVGVQEFNRARVSLRLDRENLNYRDVALIGGGFADQDQRDHTTTTGTARLEYGVSPDTALVAQISANMRDYRLHPPRSQFDRDSMGTSYLVGINTDLTKLVRGELIVGYLQQDYDDPALKTAKGLALEANIQYFPTPLTTVTLKAKRQVEETLTGTASSYVATYTQARIDHELRRNVLLTAGIGATNRDFQGASRTDDVMEANAGARFLLNRRMELGARWQYEKQNSSGPIADPDYDVNRFVVSASVRF